MSDIPPLGLPGQGSGINALLGMMSQDIMNLSNQVTALSIRIQVLLNTALKKGLITKEELEEEHKALVEEFKKQMTMSKLVTPNGQTIVPKPGEAGGSEPEPPPKATA